MKSSLAELRWIVLPWGAESGERIVIDAVNGEISFYDADDVLVIQLGPDTFGDQAIQVMDALGNAIKAYVETSFLDLPTLEFTAVTDGLGIIGNLYADAFGTGPTSHLDFVMGTNSTGTDTKLIVRSGSPDGVTQRAEIAVTQPVVVDGETWHTSVLQNGWNTVGVTPFQPPGYTRDAGGRVQLRGVMANGTRTNGTTVFNLPAAYRPAKRKQIPISLNPTTSPTTAVVQVLEAGFAPVAGSAPGDVQIYGVGASTVVGFDGASFDLI